jgi:hypothetical protein
MKRIRWFAAKWPVTLRTLASKMRSHIFKEDSFDGFLLDRVRENIVGGRYIEKVSFQETIKDPFGDERTFDRILYRQLEFNLFPTFPNIEFLDAPRSTNAYLSKLLELTNFELTVSPLSVDLIEWADSFQKLAKAKLVIDSIQISGLEIERGVTARMTIAGENDVRDALQRVTGSKKYELERLHLKYFVDSVLIPIQLTNTGSAKIDDEFADDLLPWLRSSLPHPR